MASLDPEQAAKRIVNLEAVVKKLSDRVDKLERKEQERERSERSASARMGRF